MKNMHIQFRIIALVLFSVLIVVPTQYAEAAYCDVGGMGRDGCVGYFNGDKSSATFGIPTDVILGGLYPSGANDFINTIRNYHDSDDDQNKKGASFIINVMMGRDGPGYGVNVPAAVIDDWEARVRYYNSNGWIDWNAPYDQPLGSRNSAWFSDIANPAFHEETTPEIVSVIEFNYPGAGGLIRIQRSCGNFVGTLSTLQQEKRATLRASASSIPTVAVGDSATYRFRVVAEDVLNVGTSTFDWEILRTDVSPESATSSFGSTRIWSAASGNPRIDTSAAANNPIPFSRTYNTPGVRCFTIHIKDAGTPNWVTRSPARAEACVNWIQPVDYSTSTTKENGSTSSNDYEKGGDPVLFNHNIIVNTFPCDTDNSDTWINSLNWTAEGSNSGGSTPIGGSTSGTVKFENCGNRIIVNDTTIVTSSGGGEYLLTTYNTNADLTTLDSAVPGSQFGRQTTVGAAGPEAASLLVFEAPFARFLGNDVLVCGDGEENRFVWDNRSPGGSDARGSNSEYATIFSDNNAPISNYQGLNSYSYTTSTSRNNLETKWDPALCDKTVDNIPSDTPLTTNVFQSATPYSGFYNVGSSVYISGNINGGYNLSTLPEDYNVVIIRADGDIYIDKAVTEINAILVATGNVYTCSISNGTNGAPVAQGNYETECTAKLTINGAIIADQVHFMRAHGTRYAVSSPLNEPAETINYPWQLHHAQSSLITPVLSDIDSLVDLPPRL